MRKLIAGFAVSIDGFIEGPNGEYDWIIFDKEQQKELADHWKRIDAMFYGRKTYEAAIAMQAKTKGKKQQNPFAHMKHYVFSNSLQAVDEDFILVKGETVNEIKKIKNYPGKDIAVFVGAEFACSLINLGLVDEIQLAMCPIILGTGKPFFSDISKRIHLNLLQCKSYTSGLISLKYSVNS